MSNMPLALFDVAAERARQDEKWGPQRHVDGTWAAILGEEFGEACEAALKGRPDELRKELIQVAAVAVAWVQLIDEGAPRVSTDELQQSVLSLRGSLDEANMALADAERASHDAAVARELAARSRAELEKLIKKLLTDYVKAPDSATLCYHFEGFRQDVARFLAPDAPKGGA